MNRPRTELARQRIQTFVFDTWGTPKQAAHDIALAVEAHARGMVYVRPHLRRWPKKEEPT